MALFGQALAESLFAAPVPARLRALAKRDAAVPAIIFEAMAGRQAPAAAPAITTVPRLHHRFGDSPKLG
jgi:hypothetical protein